MIKSDNEKTILEVLKDIKAEVYVNTYNSISR
jgi:hypothetical protein